MDPNTYAGTQAQLPTAPMRFLQPHSFPDVQAQGTRPRPPTSARPAQPNISNEVLSWAQTLQPRSDLRAAAGMGSWPAQAGSSQSHQLDTNQQHISGNNLSDFSNQPLATLPPPPKLANTDLSSYPLQTRLGSGELGSMGVVPRRPSSDMSGYGAGTLLTNMDLSSYGAQNKTLASNDMSHYGMPAKTLASIDNGVGGLPIRTLGSSDLSSMSMQAFGMQQQQHNQHPFQTGQRADMQYNQLSQYSGQQRRQATEYPTMQQQHQVQQHQQMQQQSQQQQQQQQRSMVQYPARVSNPGQGGGNTFPYYNLLQQTSVQPQAARRAPPTSRAVMGSNGPAMSSEGPPWMQGPSARGPAQVLSMTASVEPQGSWAVPNNTWPAVPAPPGNWVPTSNQQSASQWPGPLPSNHPAPAGSSQLHSGYAPVLLAPVPAVKHSASAHIKPPMVVTSTVIAPPPPPVRNKPPSIPPLAISTGAGQPADAGAGAAANEANQDGADKAPLTIIKSVRVHRVPRQPRAISDSTQSDYDLSSNKMEPGPPKQEPPPRPKVHVPVPQVLMPSGAPAITWDLNALLLTQPGGPMPFFKAPAASVMDHETYRATVFFSALNAEPPPKPKPKLEIKIEAAPAPAVAVEPDALRIPPAPAEVPLGVGRHRLPDTPVLAMPDSTRNFYGRPMLESEIRRRNQRMRKRSAAWMEAEEAEAALAGAPPAGRRASTREGRGASLPFGQLAPPPPRTASTAAPAGAIRGSKWHAGDSEMSTEDMDMFTQDASGVGDDEGLPSDWDMGSDEGSEEERKPVAKRRKPAVAESGAAAKKAAAAADTDEAKRPPGSPHPAIKLVTTMPDTPQMPAVQQETRTRPERKRRPSQRLRSSPEPERPQPPASEPSRPAKPSTASGAVTAEKGGTPQPASKSASRKANNAQQASKPPPQVDPALVAAKKAAAAAAAREAAAAAAAAKNKPRPPPKRATSPCIRHVPPDTLLNTPVAPPNDSKPGSRTDVSGLLDPPAAGPSSQSQPGSSKAAARGSPSPTRTGSLPAPFSPPQPPPKPEVPCMHPRGRVAPAWLRGSCGPLPPSAVASDSEWAAAQEPPQCVISHTHPDFVPGDQFQSMVAWLRGLSMDLREKDWDMALYHTYQHRYLDMLQRARVLEQRNGELDAKDTLADPSNLPGTRPITRAERAAKKAALHGDVDLPQGQFGYRARQHRAGPVYHKPIIQPLKVGYRYQAELPACRVPLPPPPPPSPEAPRAPSEERSPADKKQGKKKADEDKKKAEEEKKKAEDDKKEEKKDDAKVEDKKSEGAEGKSEGADCKPADDPPKPEEPPKPMSRAAKVKERMLEREREREREERERELARQRERERDKEREKEDLPCSPADIKLPPPPPPHGLPLLPEEEAMLGTLVINPMMLEDRELAAQAAKSGRQRATTRRAASAAAILAEKRKKAQRVVYPPHQELCATVGRQLAAAGNLANRHKIMDNTIKDMDESMQDLVAVLGVSEVGSKVRSDWSASDEALFFEGLKDHDRDFDMVRKNFLPHKSMKEVISYYYNIWKIRYTEDSVAWHEERKQLKELAREEEELNALAAREAEELLETE